jgi:hypothetical protein
MCKANHCPCGCGVTPTNYRQKFFDKWSKGYPFQDSGLYYCANYGKPLKNGNTCTFVSVKCPKAHVDHVIPKAKGGLNCINNLRIMCEHCNISKNASVSRAAKHLSGLGHDDMRLFHKKTIISYENCEST